MSRMQRRYKLHHVMIVVVLFVIAAGVNLIPRESEISAPCAGSTKIKQEVRVTSRGWPLTYSKKYEAKSVCLVFENGKYKNAGQIEPRQDLNVGAVLVNELAIIVAVTLLLIGMSRIKLKGKKHE